ncbi:SGNH/GDSL hydrolase family protein [Clostridium magnum]|uniref:GDSL-like lipase/acylhydrolase n=1 Tax=Clostridium magnum DSM 2767 TaxID=1121326 RepID=A0A162T5S6_9CLOT|nr:SGNH/GDSL hydrolase family protein [Clostridium magnum]KZL92270.1 GDSL-like lipase/acylhydrolase [Clostridium magnum DSM 2767]SHH15500.1 Lysophospholipase L1 [Clostridium magnum DSM 2767]
MYKKIIWVSVLTLAITSILVFSAGFIASLKITSAANRSDAVKSNIDISTQSKSSVELNNNSYNILVMGDSLAKGIGDEKGQGFANDFAGLWKTKTTKDIKVTNIAVNGDTSSGLIQILKNEQTLKGIESSKIIFISIGGNEIKKIQSANVSSLSTDIKTVEDNYLSNLKGILKSIRSRNKDSIIVFIGLYNPFEKDGASDKTALLNDWNFETEQLIFRDSNSIFIPTYDLFRYNLDKYLSADNFHPNAAGYDAISKRIFEALKNYGE